MKFEANDLCLAHTWSHNTKAYYGIFATNNDNGKKIFNFKAIELFKETNKRRYVQINIKTLFYWGIKSVW